jgi:serine/threonine-protein kinase RsbW
VFEEIEAGRIHSFGGPESSACALQSRHSVPFVELRDVLPSDVDIISPFADQLIQFISRFRGGNNFEIDLALREVLANAIVHGNQEDFHKCIYLSCRCTTDGDISITVQDEGQGFEGGIVPDPTTPENRLRTSGRGIYLITALMDEVRFEHKGTVVRMLKRSNVQSAAERATR